MKGDVGLPWRGTEGVTVERYVGLAWRGTGQHSRGYIRKGDTGAQRCHMLKQCPH